MDPIMVVLALYQMAHEQYASEHLEVDVDHLRPREWFVTGTWVVVRTYQAGNIELFAVAGDQVQAYRRCSDPDPNQPLAGLTTYLGLDRLSDTD